MKRLIISGKPTEPYRASEVWQLEKENKQKKKTLPCRNKTTAETDSKGRSSAMNGWVEKGSTKKWGEREIQIGVWQIDQSEVHGEHANTSKTHSYKLMYMIVSP